MSIDEISFRAAIFDLDGTLLDSLWVWRDVDRQFFAARHMDVPDGYTRAIQGMSFRETAEYTVRRFSLAESVDAVMDEWTRMTAHAYAHRVELKPGALDCLRALKRAGVKLAVATANREALFIPALDRCGALPLFDALCTSAEIGDGNKSDGALFQLAAQKLGVAPEGCVVFEDTWEGISGAKRAGMHAVCVRDESSLHNHERIAALADGMIDVFSEVRFPGLLNAKGRCVIFTARCDGDPQRAYIPRHGDYVLCADGGWQLAMRMGVRPDCVIGDFDSSDEPVNERTERVPVEKDDTDTMLCLKRGLALGYDNFMIVGGFGGRLDHTFANLQALRYAAARHASIEMCDGLSWASAVVNGSLRVPADALGTVGAKLSVFALSDVCRGVCIRGTKYTMEDGALTGEFPLGVSNDFAADCAEISVADGALLVTVCSEPMVVQQ